MSLISIILLGLLPVTVLAITVFGMHNFVLAILFFHIGVCLLLPIVDIVLIQKKSIKEYFSLIGFKDLRKNLKTGLLWGGIFMVIIVVFNLLTYKHFTDPETITAMLRDMNYQPQYILLYFVFMVVGNSLLEEVYWRGYIFHKLKSVVSLRVTIILTAIFYASYHLMMTVPFLGWGVGIFLTTLVLAAGLFWGWLREKRGSIWSMVISHALADLGIFYVLFFHIVK